MVHRLALTSLLLASASCAMPAHSTRDLAAVPAVRAVAPVSAPAATSSKSAVSSFAGRWTTTFGPMELRQDGAHVVGHYEMGGAKCFVEGREAQGKLTFRYREPTTSGEGWFELADGGRAFTGRWRADGTEAWSQWSGTRAEAVSLAPTFAGAWRSSYGTLRIALDGAHATGRYSYGAGGTIDGVVEGRILRLAYTEPGDVVGRATFELSEDGASFRGVWKQGAAEALALDDATAGSWSGERIVPVPGRVWLVVLEAYWQGDLHEPDYSYGEMLGAFFERLPNVAFRQRFFHDEADFLRLARECEALDEPVVLYVSSHGSPDGIASPGGNVSGATIGAAVAGIGNVKLVHLGACEALAGKLPDEIRAAAGKGARFPISGFTRSVDWGGSALVDFTYLDLVLERGLEPEAAVAETRRLVAFASGAVLEGAAIPATDLTIDVASVP